MPDLVHGVPDAPTFVTHLECGLTGERHEADRPHNLSRAGKPLLVRYDLDAVRRAFTKTTLAGRAPTLWRYRELLPVRRTEDVVTLGETMTPLVSCVNAQRALGVAGEILVKDEARLPETIRLPVELMMRGSVAAPATHHDPSRQGARSIA